MLSVSLSPSSSLVGMIIKGDDVDFLFLLPSCGSWMERENSPSLPFFSLFIRAVATSLFFFDYRELGEGGLAPHSPPLPSSHFRSLSSSLSLPPFSPLFSHGRGDRLLCFDSPFFLPPGAREKMAHARLKRVPSSHYLCAVLG